MSQILLKKSSPLSNDAISNGGLSPTTSDAGLLKIAGTECFDPSVSSARDLLFDRWDKSFPHIVRVIGILPKNFEIQKTRKELLKALSKENVGTVLIGGIDNFKLNDLQYQVNSIPRIAHDLQALGYTNSVFGKMCEVYGTVPVTGKPSLDEVHLGFELQKGLKQALLFRGQDD
jgi:hypothetical protein